MMLHGCYIDWMAIKKIGVVNNEGWGKIVIFWFENWDWKYLSGQ